MVRALLVFIKDFSLDIKEIDSEEFKKKVQELHLQIPYFRVISWDIALDKNDDPVLLEMNVFGQGVGQQAHAGPFFKEYTDEVLAIYKTSK